MSTAKRRRLGKNRERRRRARNERGKTAAKEVNVGNYVVYRGEEEEAKAAPAAAPDKEKPAGQNWTPGRGRGEMNE